MSSWEELKLNKSIYNFYTNAKLQFFPSEQIILFFITMAMKF